MPSLVRTPLVAFLLVAVLTACGAGPTDPGDSADPSVAVAPAAPTVVQGESGTVTVTVSDFGDADVALDVTGLPSGVTATFDPDPLTGGATESTLTLAVDATADEGTSDLTVTASSADGDATATVTLTVSSTPPELTVSVTPDALTVQQGESGDATVTITGGTGADVVLSATNVPTDVDVAFTPATLTGSTTTATATVTVGGTASVATTDVTIVATQEGSDTTVTLSLSVEATTVEGRVVTLFDQGIPGISVAIDDQVVTTDVNGMFTIPGVTPPYDLVVFRTGANPVAHVFQGLESLEPTVLPLTVIQGALGLPTGTLEGTLTDAPPLDHETVVCAEGTLVVAFGCSTTITEPATTYSVGPTWSEGVAASIRLHALEREVDTDGYPVAYTGYVTRDPILLYNGDTLPGVDIPAYAAAPATDTISGTASPPAGFDVTTLWGAAGVSSTYQMSAFRASGTLSTSFSVLMPVLGEDAFALMAQARTPDFAQSYSWTGGVAGGTTGVTLPLPSPPTLVEPADGATGVDGATVFALSGAPDAVRTFVFQPPGATSGTVIGVTTEAESTTLPDLTHLDPVLTIPSSVTYEWAVIESPTVASMDGGGATRWIEDYFGSLISIQLGGPLTVESGSITTTATREFTAD